MDTIGARLRSERVRLGFTQEAFASLAGASKPSQVRYENGDRSPDGNYFSLIAREGADVLYILTGERSDVSLPQTIGGIYQGMMQREMARWRDGEPQSDFVELPVYGASLAAGDGADNAEEDIVDRLAFSRAWLKKVGIPVSRAVLAKAVGESMVPTIHPDDMLLIDRARSTPPSRPRSSDDTRQSRIFALLDGDGGARVKRVELAAPGTLALLSDNPSVAAEFCPAEAVTIIGRVMWWGHTDRD